MYKRQGELALPNGRVAPAELVNEVQRFIELPELRLAKGKGIAQISNEISQLIRSVLTNVDLAAGYIQGNLIFFRKTDAWMKAQAYSVVSMVDDLSGYHSKYYDSIDRGIKNGAVVVPLEFMFAEHGLASLPTRIPLGIGATMKAFNRAFENFTFVATHQLYMAAETRIVKSLAVGADPTQTLVSLSQAIRKELGVESYAILGVRPTQQTIESLSLFASRFFRAVTGLPAQAMFGRCLLYTSPSPRD